MEAERIPDNEEILRRVPNLETHFREPDEITSANFKLRPGEDGLSAYRSSIVAPGDVLSKPDAMPGSRLVRATVGDIRRLRSGAGQPLNLDVVRIRDENDPGHVEIVGSDLGKLTPAASKALRDLFRLTDDPGA